MLLRLDGYLFLFKKEPNVCSEFEPTTFLRASQINDHSTAPLKVHFHAWLLDLLWKKNVIIFYTKSSWNKINLRFAIFTQLCNHFISKIILFQVFGRVPLTTWPACQPPPHPFPSPIPRAFSTLPISYIYLI
jgi:hypothetical protein